MGGQLEGTRFARFRSYHSLLENRIRTFKDGLGIIGAPVDELFHPLLIQVRCRQAIISYIIYQYRQFGEFVALGLFFSQQGGANEAVHPIHLVLLHVQVFYDALNHTLVDQLFEGFNCGHQTLVVQKLMPHPGVHQVANRVFGAPNVQVHLPPIVHRVLTGELLIVLRVHVAQEVPGRTRRARHGIGFPRHAIRQIHPVRCPRQRCLAARAGFKIVHIGQFQRQVYWRHRLSNAIGIVSHRERLAPVTLATEQGIAQFVVDLAFAQAHTLDAVQHFINGRRHFHAIQKAGIDDDALFIVAGGAGVIGLVDYVDDF